MEEILSTEQIFKEEVNCLSDGGPNKYLQDFAYIIIVDFFRNHQVQGEGEGEGIATIIGAKSHKLKKKRGKNATPLRSDPLPVEAATSEFDKDSDDESTRRCLMADRSVCITGGDTTLRFTDVYPAAAAAAPTPLYETILSTFSSSTRGH
uniref:Uncharacterized protein n=1 Tax=Oryza punctata TaxID=4537 RepID=A0A0E0LTP2_ORYPU